MRLKNGDVVMYEEPATIGEDGFPHINMVIKKVKSAVMEGIQFLDEEDNLNHNYRVRFIFRDGGRIENCCYDFLRIAKEISKLEKKESVSKELDSNFP